MSSTPFCPADSTLATDVKSTWPESGEKTTLCLNASQALPAVHEPHDAVEQPRTSALKRSTNWKNRTVYRE